MSDTSIAFGQPDDSEIDEQRLAGLVEELDSSARNALDRNLDDREGFQDRIFQKYGRGLETMDLFYYSAVEVADWAQNMVYKAQADEDDPEDFDQYYMVVRGLTARALAAYAEVTWLLRGGFPNGALTRVRFMHEIYVTAMVLAEYGSPEGEHPELVDRYLEHRDVFTRATADDLMSTGTLDPAAYFSQDVLDALEQRRSDLLARYGKNFGHMWGWAAPLFPGAPRISMKMMNSLVVPESHYFYTMTSAHVHAGSEGWYESFVAREDETVLASGPTNVGLALPAGLATAFLLDVLQVVVPSRIERDGFVEDTGAYFQAALARMSTSISDHMWRGESAVEQDELDYQERVRLGTSAAGPRVPRIRGLALRLTHQCERRLRRSL